MDAQASGERKCKSARFLQVRERCRLRLHKHQKCKYDVSTKEARHSKVVQVVSVIAGAS